jgi:hypothetical protein
MHARSVRSGDQNLRLAGVGRSPPSVVLVLVVVVVRVLVVSYSYSYSYSSS